MHLREIYHKSKAEAILRFLISAISIGCSFISTVLSFVALVLAYDSISGEREAGTLRLMLANTIPRYKLLLGKYSGSMLTLAIPLIVGLLVSLIIVIPSKDVAIDAAAWLKILVITLLSLLYLSIFVLLGLTLWTG